MVRAPPDLRPGVPRGTPSRSEAPRRGSLPHPGQRCPLSPPPVQFDQLLTMARPSPSPPCFRLDVPSACRKRSNRWGRNSGDIPGRCPHLISRVAPDRPLRTSTRPPWRRELHRVREQVPEDLLQPVRVAAEDRRLRGRRQREPTPLGVRRGRTASIAAPATGRGPPASQRQAQLPAAIRQSSSRSSISRACALTLRSRPLSRAPGWGRRCRPCATRPPTPRWR